MPELLPGTSLFRSQPVDKNHEKDGTFSSIKRALTSENFSQKKLKEKNTILLVEENEELRSFLIQVLSGEYNICAVSEAESACETIVKEQPDVILLASTFTNLSGEALCLR